MHHSRNIRNFRVFPFKRRYKFIMSSRFRRDIFSAATYRNAFNRSGKSCALWHTTPADKQTINNGIVKVNDLRIYQSDLCIKHHKSVPENRT